MADQTFSFEIKVDSDTGALTVLGDKLQQTGQKAQQAEGSFAGLSKEAGGLLKSVLPFATAGGIIAFFQDSVREAEKENEALRKLSGTLQANGISWKDASNRVQEWSKSVQEATRFSDTEAFESLGRMARATNDLSQAQKASQIAMNLSVTTGKGLAETTELVAMLMQGNERAVMMANREYGNLAGNAHTAQQALDSLDRTTKNAAENEKSFTKELAQMNSKMSDFKEEVGRGMIPGIVLLVDALKSGFDWVQKLGIVFATNAAIGVTAFTGLGRAVKEAFTGNLQQAQQELSNMKTGILAIVQESATQITAIDDKKSAHVMSNLQKEVRAHAGKSAKSEDLEAQEAAKVLQIHAQMEQKLQGLGQQTLNKKLAALNAETAASRKKIQTEIKNEVEKHKLLAELSALHSAQEKQFTIEDVEIKRAAALDVVDLSLQTLSIVNSMGKQGGQAAANRAKVILGLEQAIAIARVWAASASFGPYGAAIAAAQTALYVAQFAQQFKAIDQASSAMNSGQTSFQVDTTSLQPGGGSTSDLVTLSGGGSLSTPGSPRAPRSAGSAGGGGAAGAGLSINFGGITINVDVSDLTPGERNKMFDQLADELRKRTIAAVRFAVESASVAGANSALAS